MQIMHPRKQQLFLLVGLGGGEEEELWESHLLSFPLKKNHITRFSKTTSLIYKVILKKFKRELILQRWTKWEERFT